MSAVILALGRIQSKRQVVGVLATTFKGHYWPDAGRVFGTCMQVDRAGKFSRYVEVLGLMRSFQPDVVHIHHEPYAPLLARLAQAPVVVETIHHLGYWKKNGNWLLRKFRPYLVDRSITVSVAQREQVIAEGLLAPAKVAAVPNGIELESVPVATSAKKIPMSIGAMGRFVPWKGFDSLIIAFAEVRRAFPEATLHLAGDGEQREHLGELVSSLGLTECVHFWGYVRAPREFIRSMHTMVFSSLHEEPFGLVAAEVMAEGTPLVASRIPAIMEICRPGDAVFFEPGDPGDLARSIGNVLGDPLLAEQATRAAYARVRDCFSIERMAADYDVIYRTSGSRVT